MNGHSASTRVPCLGDLEAEARAILLKLDPRRLQFLDQKGEWAENPESVRDRIAHAFLYHLRSRSEGDKASFFVQAFTPFLTESRWPIAVKMAASRAPASKSSLLVVFEALFWVLEHEAWRANAEAPAPEWNTEARAFQAESRAKQHSLEESLASLLSIKEWKEFLEAKAEVTRSAAEGLAALIRLVAEEERHCAALARLVVASSDP